MSRPKLSWLPLRCVRSMVETAWPTRQAVLRQARQDLGLSHMEIHHALVTDGDPHDLADVKNLLRWYKLTCSALVCAPDFTNPDPDQRAAELERMKAKLETARAIGAPGLRVTAGPAREGAAPEDCLAWAGECLLRLADEARPLELKLSLENHFRDPLWGAPDAAYGNEAFLSLWGRVRDSDIGVCLNCSTPLVAGEDVLDLLPHLEGRIWIVHVSDRLPGVPSQTVLGEGMADLEGVLGRLAESGYEGFVAYEDGNPEANRGTRRSFDLLRSLIARAWPEEEAEECHTSP